MSQLILDEFVKEKVAGEFPDMPDESLDLSDLVGDTYVEQNPPIEADVSPELEGIWGQPQASAMRFLPNRDKDLTPKGATRQAGDPRKALWHLQKAIRLSHYGRPLGEIRSYLDANLPKQAAKRAFRVVQEGHGLAGRVYIQAGAFPGLKNGKWVKEIKRACRTARYVVTHDPVLASKIGLPAVESVPWKKALKGYESWLRASGYAVEAQDSARETLRVAFLTGPQKPVHEPTPKPVPKLPVDQVTLSEAKAALASSKPETLVVQSDPTQKERTKVRAALQRAHKAGLLTSAETLKLIQSNAPPKQVHKAAQQMAARRLIAKRQEYQGEGVGVTTMGRHQETKLAQGEVENVYRKRALAHVQKMADSGQITAKEARRCAREASAKSILKMATAYANASGTRKIEIKASTPASEYKGAVQKVATTITPKRRALSAHAQRLHEASRRSGIKVGEFQAMEKWLRRQMSEGFAGKDLTDLIRHRIATPLRTAGQEIIDDLRSEHEGLAGHLYVDAQSYASKTGTTGCESGAIQHRANQIPFVKAMDRCQGCVFASQGQCTKYNKQLISVVDPQEVAGFKAKIMAAADAPDHEMVAALFDPNEFRLGTQLDHVEVDEPAFAESLDGIVFGEGMQW